MTTPYASETFLNQLLGKALAASASDVHLRVGQPPGARVRGDMVYFRVDKIRPDDTEAVARILLGAPAARDPLEGRHESTTAYQMPGVGRFRVTVYRQRGSLAIVMRSIAPKVPTLEELGLPPIATSMCEQPRGLVIIAAAGSHGKTSTLAAMVKHLNAGYAKHIITIEDPIEFLHEDERSSVSQREVGTDAASMLSALQAAHRQDPDVIVCSSIEAPGVLSAVLDIADAGRLVITSVPVLDVPRAVARLLAAAEATDDKDHLIENLQGIIAQRLLPKRDGSGLVLAAEIFSSPARDILRRPDVVKSLKDLMEKGVHGMQTFEAHMRLLITANKISKSSLPG